MFIQEPHPPVAGIMFKRAAIFDDDLANCRMVLTQQRYHVFWIRPFREAGEPAKVTEQSCNFSAVAFESLLRSGGDDQIGYLGRKETSQSTHAFDFADLVRDTLFKLLVQLVEIIEQSRVLDRYHRLVGKRLDQLNLPIREKPDFSTVQSDSTDRVSVPQHWHSEKCPNTERLASCGVDVIRLRCNVRNMKHVALKNTAPYKRAGV